MLLRGLPILATGHPRRTVHPYSFFLFFFLVALWFEQWFARQALLQLEPLPAAVHPDLQERYCQGMCA
jgi:hypothetical protein